MRRAANAIEQQLMALGAAATGVLFTAGAALAAEQAQAHMLALGTICGAGSHPHCGGCFGAAGLGMAGLAGFVAALRLSPRPALLRSR
jgi:hypothetical protein